MATAPKFSCVLVLGCCLFPFSALAGEKPVSNWTGWHGGIGAGYGMLDHTLSGAVDAGGGPFTFAGSGKLTGIAGEGGLLSAEFGYDQVIGNGILLGATADYTRSSISTDLNFDPVVGQLQASDAISLLVRGGRIINDNTVLYSLAGWTHTRMEGDASAAGLFAGSYNYATNGLTLGGGVETAIADNWTLKFEHRITYNGRKTLLDDDLDLGGFGTANLVVGERVHEQTARIVLSYRPGIVAPQFSGEDLWTGFRVGGAAGYGMVNHVIASPASPDSFSGLGGEGFLGSVEAGYDQLVGERLVLGAQADYTYSDISTKLSATDGTDSISFKAQPTHNVSLLARAGVLTSPDVMFYGIGGWTHSRFDLGFSITGDPPLNEHHSLNGLTLGGGAEVQLNDRWSWKAEYRYTDYEDWDALDLGAVKLQNNIQSVRTTLAYHL
ncbi:MAG: outer membrane beta-barrel protein [Hyphomicrobiales bacterium]